MESQLLLNSINTILVQNNIYVFSKKDLNLYTKESSSKILSHINWIYGISSHGKKKILLKLIKESIIDGIKFYSNEQLQVFVDMEKFVELLLEHKFKIVEKKFIRIKNYITAYDSESQRLSSFKTIPMFKKWIEPYMPCDIKELSIKKNDEVYLVSCQTPISIPYEITSIKGLRVELSKIDTRHHRFMKTFEIINYKEKKLIRLSLERITLERALQNQAK